MTIKGLIAFPITPMSAEGRVDQPAFRRLVKRLVEAEVDGIGALGSTGSYPFLSREERRRALDAAVAEVDGRMPVMAGVGALRTDDAITFARDAKAAGASAGLLAPISYTPLTDDEVFEHFAAVAGESGLPICIYNNPAATHFNVSIDLLARLSRIAGVVAAKWPAPLAEEASSDLAALRVSTPEGFSCGYSTDVNAVEAMIAGGDAWYSVLAGLAPVPCVRILRAIAEGDVETAREINRNLEPVWSVFRSQSGLRVIYAAANLLGLCEAAPPRPILPLTGDALKQVAALVESGLLQA